MQRKKIAILGGTGYIGTSLLSQFAECPEIYELILFSRDVSKINKIANAVLGDCAYSVFPMKDFPGSVFDVVINCTGIGDPKELNKNPFLIFQITESVDSMIISELEKRPEALYVNLSSGAVYGNNFSEAITISTQSVLPINALTVSHYYAIAKINAEAKHRALKHLNIIDLRVFAFFSSAFDPEAGFLMSEIAKSIQTKSPFVTTVNDLVRDYVSPSDLFSLIVLCMKQSKYNDFFDVYSKEPVSKLELMSHFEKDLGLLCQIVESNQVQTSQAKNVYYSVNKKAEVIGYFPEYSSLESVTVELKKYLSGLLTG